MPPDRLKVKKYKSVVTAKLAMAMARLTWLAASWVLRRVTHRTAWRELPPVGEKGIICDVGPHLRCASFAVCETEV